MTEDEVENLKKRIHELEVKLDTFKEFTIGEIAKTNVGMLKKDKKKFDENLERGAIQ